MGNKNLLFIFLITRGVFDFKGLEFHTTSCGCVKHLITYIFFRTFFRRDPQTGILSTLLVLLKTKHRRLPMGKIIEVNERFIKDQLGEMVRGTVEEALNTMLDNYFT
jgi:hypothetical protein